MGIFDDIVNPIKKAIEKPIDVINKGVEEVEHVFGEVVTFSEDLVKEFEQMIRDMEDLFKVKNVEMLFLDTFKNGAFTAISDIEKIATLMSAVSGISTEGLGDDLKASIRDTYSFLKGKLAFMTSELETIMAKIEDDEQGIKRGIYHEFERVKSLAKLLPLEIKILSRKIAEEFKVEGGKAFAVIPEFGEFAEKEGKDAFQNVKKVGTATRESFENLEQSIRKRLAAESAQVDLLPLLIVGLIVLLIVGIFMLTKSWIVVKIVAAFIAFVILAFIVSEIFIRLF